MPSKMTRAEQKAQRPQEIMEAAFEEFAIKGYAATRLDDIARRLGISKGTIYLYFPTKEALFEAMAHYHSKPYRDVLKMADSFQGTCGERLRQLLLFAFEKISKDTKIQQMLRLSLSEGIRLPEIVERHYDEFVEPLAALISKLLREGVDAGEFRDGPASGTPEVVMSAILNLMILHINVTGQRHLNKSNLIDAHLDLMLNGLRAR